MAAHSLADRRIFLKTITRIHRRFMALRPALRCWRRSGRHVQRSSVGVAAFTSVSLLLGACQAAVTARPDKLAPWTPELREQQPDDAYAAVYMHDSQALVVIGAKHATQADSLTFRLINTAYDVYEIDTVIVEGPPYSRGANADRLLRWAQAQPTVDGFVQAGEIVPAVRGALKEGAAIWGGEPDDAYLLENLLSRGFSAQDVLGFYTLRSIPQWVRERKISDASDSRLRALIESELDRNRERLALSVEYLPNHEAWADWYEKTNSKRIGEEFDLAETGPLANGPYGSNRVAAGIAQVRDGFLLEIIANHWNAGENVMTVFGGSHLMILRPALDAMFGPPCYAGSHLQSAKTHCAGSAAVSADNVKEPQ